MKLPVILMTLVLTASPMAGAKDTPKEVAKNAAVETGVSPSGTEKKKSAGKESCSLCEKVDKLRKHPDDGDKKAARALADLLATAELSKDKKIRKQELVSILAASLVLIAHDERLELPDYLMDLEDDYPEEYHGAMADWNEADRRTIEKYTDASRAMKKNGEEDAEP